MTSSQDHNTSQREGRGFQFLRSLEITAVGLADAGLNDAVPQILEALGLSVDPDSLRLRPSSAGKYVSVTVSFVAQCRADYEAAHGALRAHSGIKWTL